MRAKRKKEVCFDAALLALEIIFRAGQENYTFFSEK